MSNCVSEIIGVKKIALYINNGARFERPDVSVENEVNLIVTESENFLLTDIKSQMKWERTLAFSGNYKQNYFDEFTFLLHGVQNEIPEIIKTIRKNRLGYIIEIITTGNKSLVFQSPVFLNNENTKQIDSHSWNISLSYRIPSFLNNLTLLDVTIGSQPEEITNNIEIQGVQKIALYVNDNAIFWRLNILAENEVALVSPVEPFIIINDANQLPKWERTINNSGNHKQSYIDNFSFLLHGIENDVPEIIQNLRNNRLGYIAEILTTGNKPFIFQSPIFLNEDNTKQVDSHSWNISLSYRVPSFKDKLILTERPLVEYRNGVISNAFFGQTAIFDFEAKINSDTQVTFTINWGAEIGITEINSIMVDGVWKALQTSIIIPIGIDPNQTIIVTDNFGDSFEVEYVVGELVPLDGLIALWIGGSILNTAPGFSGIYDGTLNGSPNPALTTGINGEANGAYNFVSANSQYVDFGVISELKNVSKFSISTWLKKTAGNTIHVSDLLSDVLIGSGIFWFTDEIVYGIVRDGVVTDRRITLTSELGNWINVVIVYDGTQATNADRLIMYVNAVLTVTVRTPFPAVTPTNSDPFNYARFTGPVYGDGQIGQTLIYNRDITAGEVAQIFAQKTV